jgi:hypothetical protein
MAVVRNSDLGSSFFGEFYIGYLMRVSLTVLKFTEFFLDFIEKNNVLTGKFRCSWEDNIKMDLQEVGCGGKDWIELAKVGKDGRECVNALMNFRVP